MDYIVPNEKVSLTHLIGSAASLMLCALLIAIIFVQMPDSGLGGAMIVILLMLVALASGAILCAGLVHALSDGFMLSVGDEGIEAYRAYRDPLLRSAMRLFWRIFTPLTWFTIHPRTSQLIPYSDVHDVRSEGPGSGVVRIIAHMGFWSRRQIRCKVPKGKEEEIVRSIEEGKERKGA